VCAFFSYYFIILGGGGKVASLEIIPIITLKVLMETRRKSKELGSEGSECILSLIILAHI
jgi:hypothetical protein